MRKRKNWYSKLYYIFISVLIITIIAIAFILYKTREDKQNRSLDYYSNFEELKENTTEGKDWRIKTKNRKDNHMLVTAIHGGGIEPGTTELARRVANIGEYDFYTFEGLM
ncbi:poly-gamma-glutamate hydrolase family protein, partial [Staphylococcus haemolyticus]